MPATLIHSDGVRIQKAQKDKDGLETATKTSFQNTTFPGSKLYTVNDVKAKKKK